ncbi:MAG: aminopeptidase [Candidatus Binatia bacterium]
MRTWLLALALLLVAGCGGPAYLARLGWSEARILWRREPIDAVLARPALDPELRRRLALVLAVRDFARDVLGLRVGESYATFAAVERDEATVWVLAAARRDRLEAHTWWYPVAGRVPYKGFFDEGGARAAAQVLAARDLDTDLRRALAFSTLGWFADPLLSTTAAAPPVELADTVIHELFHATLYVPGPRASTTRRRTSSATGGRSRFFAARRGVTASAAGRPDGRGGTSARAPCCWGGSRGGSSVSTPDGCRWPCASGRGTGSRNRRRRRSCAGGSARAPWCCPRTTRAFSASSSI